MRKNELRKPPPTPRWTELRPHPVQHEYYTSKARFNIVPAGRRSGKTELAKRRLVRRAIARALTKRPPYQTGRFFSAAPTRDQAKRIYWSDLKQLVPKRLLSGRPRETDLIIPLRNNVEIHIIGMDKPERFEGSPWDFGILDEYGNMKPEAWMENVFPALADRQGGCDLIGVPEGRNHYYDRWLEALACTDGSIRGHHWKSSEILPASEIEMARRMMDEMSFKQEFEAEFINFAGQAYYAFNEKDHVRRLKYNPHQPLIFCFDFNVSPGVAVICQEQVITGHFEYIPNPNKYPQTPRGWIAAIKEGGLVRVPVQGTGIIGEVYITNNSNTPAVCNKLIQDWGRDGKDHRGQIHIYGDATGGARGTAKVGGSDWDLIENAMCSHFGAERVFMEVPASNPPERVRINAVNTRLKSSDGVAHMAVDGKCKKMIRDFEGTRRLEGGSGEIDKKSDKMLSHMCFAANTPVNKGPIELLPETGQVRSLFGRSEYVGNVLRGYSKLVELVFVGGHTLRCTPDHSILTAQGWIAARNSLGILVPFVSGMHTFNMPEGAACAVAARGLAADAMRAFLRTDEGRLSIEFKRIIQIQELPGLHPVYCPTVNVGHFILDSGLVVSNSDAVGYYIARAFPLVDNSYEEMGLVGRF